MPSVVVVAGARPNFMKVAPIVRAIEASTRAISYELVHTGQHYDFEMSGVFFEQLGIPHPAVHLDVGSASHAAQTGRIMSAFDTYLDGRAEPPASVIVVGDVNSTMACALVATKRGVAVAHVEAGLRSGDRTMPEEINRIVTDAVSSLLLVSEPAGLANLEREGVPSSRVRYVGNVMIDTLVRELAAARTEDMASRFGVTGDYAVVTLHRAANVDDKDRLRALTDLVRRVASELPVVFAVHPRTGRQLDVHGLRSSLETAAGVHLVPPLGYREFIGLVDRAKLVLTDSGGVQEETTFLGVPCITLRTTTERPVTVTQGTNRLVGENLQEAWRAVADALQAPRRPPSAIDGWDGRAAVRIVDALFESW